MHLASSSSVAMHDRSVLVVSGRSEAATARLKAAPAGQGLANPGF